MARLIKEIRNGNVVEYDSGAFDNWCVYLKRPNMGRYAPRDNEYFRKLLALGRTHGFQKIYNDFITIYNQTNKSISPGVLQLITSISNGYGADAEEIEIWFTVIYAGMVAEENKEFTKLGKRVKRLGMHQVLIDKMAPEHAANFSKGKPWRELDAIMVTKGF
jgi:hypothetical protein